jgi:hypothetical protein
MYKLPNNVIPIITLIIGCVMLCLHQNSAGTLIVGSAIALIDPKPADGQK